MWAERHARSARKHDGNSATTAKVKQTHRHMNATRNAATEHALEKRCSPCVAMLYSQLGCSLKLAAHTTEEETPTQQGAA